MTTQAETTSQLAECLERLSGCSDSSHSKNLEFRIKTLLSLVEDSESKRSFQVQYRNALLSSTRLQNQVADTARETLLRNRLQGHKEKKVSMVNASAMVSKGLQEALEMATAQSQQGFASIQSLDESARKMEKTDAKYSEMGGRLGVSKKITSQLKNKDRTDRYLLYCGVAIFVATIAYLVWKRLWIPFL
ncbi:hypothetical protein HDV03_001381 [Kappamyces sp. JEL0829]|nr:hypothetical protein HDV03_001381 [Kappamyces sp. JEL0829]